MFAQKFIIAPIHFPQARKYRLPIVLGLSQRLIYSLWVAVMWAFMDGFFPLTDKALGETYHHLSRSTTLIGRSFIDVWLRWDAVHYMNIAKFGYSGVGKAESVFFPLYPYAVGFFSNLSGINVTLAGIIISSIAATLALVCLYELVLSLFGDKELANYSVLIFAFYPMSFFLHAPFTDALFMFLTISATLMIEKKKFFLAGILGSMAGLTRAQGILLVVIVLASYIKDYIQTKVLFQWRKIFPIIFIPMGFCGFTLWRITSGLPGIFQSYQNYSGVKFQDPFLTLIKSGIVAFQYPTFSQITEILSAVFSLIILVWMIFNKDIRKHIGVLLYSILTWILVISKTGLKGYGLQCVNRYMLHIFLVFVGIAYILKKFPPKIRNWILIGSLSLNFVNLALYSLWVFIG